ncbi:conserved membrane hypothetical protein [Desulfamplus magnetovallimortis]|uniref:Uncharacterized protein n=1 Tax=Desulfamplus magnetovallimortis TaxID=1246637 RepID=A0A1W1HHK7_9BACT|nr:DUF5698 domain-containing protein [Desulfamplus magnetovallimortis]SLM31959.1 conserved membrane hypothetical protein [Desulfamplus magnetovallimortis]
MLEQNIIITGIFVFFARICDVSIGTVRTILTVQGRTLISFILAIFEISIWALVAGTVLTQLNEKPLLIVFYAFGYATGNVVGILVERKLAFGIIILKLLTKNAGQEIADYLRQKRQPVTVFIGEGMKGPVYELYIACRRRELKWILPEVKKMDEHIFYVIEQARDMSSLLKPIATPMGGWRNIFKRK